MFNLCGKKIKEFREILRFSEKVWLERKATYHLCSDIVDIPHLYDYMSIRDISSFSGEEEGAIGNYISSHFITPLSSLYSLAGIGGGGGTQGNSIRNSAFVGNLKISYFSFLRR